MVNFVSPTTGQKYTVTLSKGTRMVGPNQQRTIVVAELYADGLKLGESMSMCHPSDAFDARKGSHLAISHLRDWFNKEELKALHKKIDGWFTN